MISGTPELWSSLTLELLTKHPPDSYWKAHAWLCGCWPGLTWAMFLWHCRVIQTKAQLPGLHVRLGIFPQPGTKRTNIVHSGRPIMENWTITPGTWKGELQCWACLRCSCWLNIARLQLHADWLKFSQKSPKIKLGTKEHGFKNLNSSVIFPFHFFTSFFFFFSLWSLATA